MENEVKEMLVNAVEKHVVGQLIAESHGNTLGVGLSMLNIDPSNVVSSRLQKKLSEMEEDEQVELVRESLNIVRDLHGICVRDVMYKLEEETDIRIRVENFLNQIETGLNERYNFEVSVEDVCHKLAQLDSEENNMEPYSEEMRKDLRVFYFGHLLLMTYVMIDNLISLYMEFNPENTEETETVEEKESE